MMVVAAEGGQSLGSFSIVVSRFTWHHVARQWQAVAAYEHPACAATRTLFPPDRGTGTPPTLRPRHGTSLGHKEAASGEVPRVGRCGRGKRQAQRCRQLPGAASSTSIVPAGCPVVRPTQPSGIRGGNNAQRRIVSRCSSGCVPNLLQQINALPCVMRPNAGQPLLVALFHLRNDLILRHRAPWQKLLQQLFNVRATQERMHVFRS